MALRRMHHKYMPTLFRRDHGDKTGPLCLTCLKPVDAEQLVEGYPRDVAGGTSGYTFCRVLYRCHGAEELVRYDFDTTDWDDRDLYRAARRHRHFDPLAVAQDDVLRVGLSS